MTVDRKSERYQIFDPNLYLVKVEVSAGKIVDCFLNDISVTGACIILDKHVFLQIGKEYSFQILEKQHHGESISMANVKGKIVWYLPKDFQDKEMLYLGVEFQNTISLSQSIITQAMAFKKWN